MTGLRAILFDVDGTLAETEEGHRRAWNAAFADHGHDWKWDFRAYRELLKVAGGRERLRLFTNGTLDDGAIVAIHRTKNDHYRRALNTGEIALRPGVGALIVAARERGITLGVATTTSRTNVEALLDSTLGPQSKEWFATIACAEDAPAKKPDPAVYVFALRQLGLSGPDAVAIEDSRNGVLAAKAAGLEVVLTPSLYMAGEDTAGADVILASLDELELDRFLARFNGRPRAARWRTR